MLGIPKFGAKADYSQYCNLALGLESAMFILPF